jgi:8-oxo-dGTP diphosphatase
MSVNKWPNYPDDAHIRALENSHVGFYSYSTRNPVLPTPNIFKKTDDQEVSRDKFIESVTTKPHCLVGTAAMIRHKNHFLVGIRKGSHCPGIWAFPGGHVELEDESLRAATEREVAEEVLDYRTGQGLKIFTYDFRLGSPQAFLVHKKVNNNTKSYVTMYMECELDTWDKIDLDRPLLSPLNERHKCEQWEWKTLDKLHEIEYNNKESWIPLDLMREYYGL